MSRRCAWWYARQCSCSGTQLDLLSPLQVFATLLGDPWSAQDVDVRCVDRVVRAVWMPGGGGGGGDGDATGDRDEDMDADYVYSRVYRPATKKFESCPAPMPQLRLR